MLNFIKEHNDTACIDVNYPGKYLATAGKDHRIRIYDLESSDVTLLTSFSSVVQDIQEDYENDALNAVQLETQAHSNRIFSIKFHREEANVFFTGGWDRTVKIWDMRSRNGVMNTIYGPSICGDGIDQKVLNFY